MKFLYPQNIKLHYHCREIVSDLLLLTKTGLKINEARHELPYRGAWLWVGSEMIHLKELPNPDPVTGRPEHAGRDRHTCIAIRDVSKLKAVLEKAGKFSASIMIDFKNISTTPLILLVQFLLWCFFFFLHL